jgi:hypothetical protein
MQKAPDIAQYLMQARRAEIQRLLSSEDIPQTQDEIEFARALTEDPLLEEEDNEEADENYTGGDILPEDS